LLGEGLAGSRLAGLPGLVFWSAPLRAARFCGRCGLPFLRLRFALHWLRIFPHRRWMRLGWRRRARRLLVVLPLGALDRHVFGVAGLRILRAWQAGGRALDWFAL